MLVVSKDSTPDRTRCLRRSAVLHRWLTIYWNLF